jgi:hypothetical protein
MHSPRDTIEMYLRAKDFNRPHLIAQAFAGGALLQMEVRQGGMDFPPVAQGREAIAETLVRSFGRRHENVYTFCLAEPPAPDSAQFHCPWLVAMTEKDSRAVRVGCGFYHWRFAPGNRLAQELRIVIDTMQTLPPADVLPVMAWVASLGGPWCPVERALATAPPIPLVRSALQLLACQGAGAAMA